MLVAEYNNRRPGSTVRSGLPSSLGFMYVEQVNVHGHTTYYVCPRETRLVVGPDFSARWTHYRGNRRSLLVDQLRILTLDTSCSLSGEHRAPSTMTYDVTVEANYFITWLDKEKRGIRVRRYRRGTLFQCFFHGGLHDSSVAYAFHPAVVVKY